MFANFFSFELRSWLRTPMPWIFLLLITLLSFFATIFEEVTIGGSFGNVYRNAPYVAQSWYAVFSLLCLLLTTAFLNTAAIRDFERQTSQIVFSKPIKKWEYYFGHFWGAFPMALFPMLGISFGMWLGTALNPVFGSIDPSRFGPFEVNGHVLGMLVIALPNSLFAAGILYAVAINTRSTLYSFVAAAALLVGYIVAGNLMRNLDNENLSMLLDPFGFRAFSLMTKYWTVDDKNTQALGFTGMMLWNRLLWCAVGLLALFIGYWRFNFSEKTRGSRKKKTDEPARLTVAHGPIPRVAPAVNARTRRQQLWSQFKTEWLGILRSTPFILLAFIGLLNCLPSLFTANESYSAHELPVTYTMVQIIRGSFYLFTIIIIVYFSGALIWKERINRVQDIVDALPTRTWTTYAGKFAAVLGVLFILQVLVMLLAIGVQAYMGYSRFDFWVYVRELLVLDLSGFAFFLAIAFLIQVLSPNMYLGFFITILFNIVNAFLWDALKIESNMVEFSGTPSYILSDFYGYQPFAQGLVWFHVYWLLFCVLLAGAGILLWPRGQERGIRARFRIAGQEWPVYRTFVLGALVLWLVTAGWTFYNTQVKNTYVTGKQEEKLRVEYEKRLKHLQGRIQPRVYSVKYDIDLRPETRTLHVESHFKMRNIYDTPIDTLYVNVPQNGEFEMVSNRLNLVEENKALKWRVFRLQPALAPGDSMDLSSVLHFEPKGFENEVTWSRVVQNGTFFDNTDVIPIFGYSEDSEIADKNDRKKYGLPEKTRWPELNRQDSVRRREAYIGINSDWVEVETVFRTAPDQIALAPGSLIREWEENGRRCFHYKLDHPSFNFYSFLSARYAVAKRTFGDVELEVYYHPAHNYNVERLLHAMEKSLAYYQENFGPYFHKQCRIIEFPRFSSFAQAFPGTMPYSEGVGFIQDFKPEKDDIDMMFYVAAHEIGHQYWGHQECGARMQGGEMLVETFAQWSALMVMEHEYGRDQMRKFLEYEMDRYLRGRGRETLREMPLARSENQGYIHYNKGSVVMYNLKEMIGEDQVNAALRAFLTRYRYQPPPYPVSLDALDEFYAHTPDSLHYLLKDLFEEITLFENQCREASVRETGEGDWEITMQVNCRKLKADDLGKETDVALRDYIEIGAFAKPEGDKRYGKTLYRQRMLITGPETTFTFRVAEKPDKVAVDPFYLLVDRNPEDNSKEL